MAVKSWISAMRLRTLPLAASCVFTGSAMAKLHGKFELNVFLLTLLTTLLLQVLSNLANDYGDSVSEVDNEKRVGPQRAVQSGAISQGSMKIGVILFAIFSFASGVWLLVEAFGSALSSKLLLFLLLGIAAIGAAIKYTVGKSPYGYRGLGVLFVFLFFGLVGVVGTYFLHTFKINWTTVLPAATVGFFSAAVLNMNNMRDHENDRQSGKHTIVVKMGFETARWYQSGLVILGWLSAVAFGLLEFSEWSQWIFILPIVIFAFHLKTVWTEKTPAKLDPELKKIALGTFAFSLLLFTGMWV